MGVFFVYVFFCYIYCELCYECIWNKLGLDSIFLFFISIIYFIYFSICIKEVYIIMDGNEKIFFCLVRLGNFCRNWILFIIKFFFVFWIVMVYSWNVVSNDFGRCVYFFFFLCNYLNCRWK